MPCSRMPCLTQLIVVQLRSRFLRCIWHVAYIKQYILVHIVSDSRDSVTVIALYARCFHVYLMTLSQVCRHPHGAFVINLYLCYRHSGIEVSCMSWHT